MPWRTERRGEEWCVIKESDGSVAGCHSSKPRALAQQAALYANEAQTASGNGQQPVRVEIASAGAPDTSERDEALVASITAISERLQSTEDVISQVVDALAKVVEIQGEDRQAFADALTAAANRPEPVVNVTVPEILIPTPTVNVHVPKTKLLVPTPVVNVTMPGSKRTVKFDRDPLTGQVSQAEIEES